MSLDFGLNSQECNQPSKGVHKRRGGALGRNASKSLSSREKKRRGSCSAARKNYVGPCRTHYQLLGGLGCG